MAGGVIGQSESLLRWQWTAVRSLFLRHLAVTAGKLTASNDNTCDANVNLLPPLVGHQAVVSHASAHEVDNACALGLCSAGPDLRPDAFAGVNL